MQSNNHKKILQKPNETLLVINAGSSNLKVSLFTYQKTITLIKYIKIHHVFELKKLFRWIKNSSLNLVVKAVGHRIVHGGRDFFEPTLMTPNVLKKLKELIPFAPIHQPQSLKAVHLIQKNYPHLPQIACFDTAFHKTQTKLAKLFAIPRHLTKNGIIRYGFHGISYEYISFILPTIIPKIAKKRIIVAHLGSGASLCAMYKGKSVATTMGFSVLDGLMMGTRTGSIDPGILLYLMQEKKYSPKQLEQMLYHKSGLLGVSNIASDVPTLIASKTIEAKEAIELFCYRAASEIGALVSSICGCDAIIFTGGIGENSASIRENICKRLVWLGCAVDKRKNRINSTLFSKGNSKVLLSTVATNEELMIASHTHRSISSR